MKKQKKKKNTTTFFAFFLLLLCWSTPVLADAPTFSSSPPLTATEDKPYSYVVEVSDRVSHDPVLTLKTSPTGMQISSTTVKGCTRFRCVWVATISWIPNNNNANKSYSITVLATDKFKSSTQQAYNLRVVNVNDAPVFTSTALTTINEDKAYTYQAVASDPDPTGDTLTYALLVFPKGMTIDKNTGRLNWLPTNAEVGQHSITIRVTDNYGAFSEQSYLLTVVNVNDPPQITSTPPLGATTGKLYTYDVDAVDIDPTKDSLSYKLTTKPTKMTINATTGLIQWTPAVVDRGKVFDVAVEVTDGKGGSVRQAWKLSVYHKNVAPQITSSPLGSATEDQAYLYNIKATDTENDDLKFSLLSAPKGMTIGKKAGTRNEGEVKWTPTNDDVKDHTIKIQVDDGKGGVVTQEYTLSVKNTNDAPVFSSVPTTSAIEDKAYSYQAKATDPDPTNDKVSFSLGQGPTGMSIDSTTGLLQWTPSNANANKSYTIIVTASDDKGGKRNQSFTIKVSNINDVPVITSTPAKTATEDQTYSYQMKASDSDPTNDVLGYRLVSSPKGMTIDAKTGLVRWTPTNEDAIQKDFQVKLEVSDGKGGNQTQAYNLTVLNTNDKPEITSTPLKGAAVGQLYKYDVDATDPDPTKDVLTYSLSQPAPGMQINGTSGLIQWTPKLSDRNKTYTITVKVTDPKGAFAQQTYIIKVIDNNKYPVFGSSPLKEATEDKAYSYQAKATDPDGDKLSYVLEQAPTGMKVNADTGLVTWTPLNENVGINKVLLRADDGKGGIVRQAFDLVVKNTNDDPIFQSTPINNALEDQQYTYNIKANDPDPTKDTVTFTLQKGPTGMQLGKSTGTLTWTPTNSDVGNHSITVQAQDGKGGSTAQSYTLVVKNVNDAPKFSSKPILQVKEDTAYTYRAEAKDPDPTSDSLSYKLLQHPKGMAIQSGNGVVTWTPDNADVGTHKIELRVEDGNGGFDVQTFTLQVTNTNDAPFFTSKPPTGATQGKEYKYKAQAKDIDPTKDRLTYKLTKSPTGMLLNPSTGEITWTPTQSQVSLKLLVTLEVSDGKAGKDIQNWVIEVFNANDPPRFAEKPTRQTTVEDKAYSYQVKATDPDKDALLYKLLQAPVGMKINPSNGLLQWTPSNDNVGTHGITIQLDDRKGGTVSHTYTLVVTNVNDAPKISSVPVTNATEDKAYTYQTTATDIDPTKDTLSYRLTSNPKGMSINKVNGVVSWTPTNADVGVHPISVEVSDGKGGTDTQKFNVTVKNVNDDPTIDTKAVEKATEDQSYLYLVKATDIDPTKDKLKFSLSKAPKGMTIQESGGLIQWTPANADVGQHPISVKVEDGNGGAATQNFVLLVSNVNDTPEFTSKPITTATEDKLYTYQVTAKDIDPTKDTLIYSLTTNPKAMTINATSGLVQWKPTNADAGKQHPVTVKVIDGKGGSAEQRYFLTVNNVNNDPKITSKPGTEVMMGKVYTYLVKASDPDPGTVKLRYLLAQAPKGMTIVEDSGLVQWSPTNLDVNKDGHEIKIRVEDGQGGSDEQAYKLKVLADPNAPAANIKPLPNLVPDEYELDGSNSTDPNSKPLKYEWALTDGPDKQVKITGADTAKPKVILRRAGKYTFRLVADNDKQKSAPAFLIVTVKNIEPIAHAGRDFAVFVGTKATLDGRRSHDSNGDRDKFTYKWTQSSGDTVTLEKAETSQPSFTASKAGIYRFSLKVSDGELESKAKEVQVFVLDPKGKTNPPMATILAPTQAKLGDTIQLDGSRSRSFAGKALKYNWSVVEGAPEGLEDAQKDKATFKPSKAGSYLIRLRVQDEKKGVDHVHRVNFVAEGKALPEAIIADKHVDFETWYTLDASQSKGDGALTYTWTQIGGPTAKLHFDDPKDRAKARFFVLHKGSYRFRLVVSQADKSSSIPREITLRVNEAKNKAPSADAGKDQFGDNALDAGTAAKLDGSKSNDPEAETLSYRWYQKSGYPVVLADTKSATPSVTAVTYGMVVIGLNVNDGKTDSLPGAQVRLLINDENNTVPVANAGEDQEVLAGVEITLDGSKSIDDDGDKLTYQWRLIGPTSVKVDLELKDPSKPSFVIPSDTKVNSYLFGLIVDDGKSQSLEDSVEIKVVGVNEAPKVKIKPIAKLIEGANAKLDASESKDPNPGDKLTFKWEQSSGPSLALKDPTLATIALSALKVGDYKFKVTVSDGTLESSAEVSFKVEPKPEPPPEGCTCSQQNPQPMQPHHLLLVALCFLGLFRRRRAPR